MTVTNHTVIEMQSFVGMAVCVVGYASVVELPEWMSFGFLVLAGMFGYIGHKASNKDKGAF